jgi:hypothetical protein
MVSGWFAASVRLPDSGFIGFSLKQQRQQCQADIITYFPARSLETLFSCQKFCKIFQYFPSHRIFGRMHKALNIDKK